MLTAWCQELERKSFDIAKDCLQVGARLVRRFHVAQPDRALVVEHVQRRPRNPEGRTADRILLIPDTEAQIDLALRVGEDCFWQGLLLSVPSFALLLWLARGLLPLRPRGTAVAAAAAAAALPAILMQFACMLDPVHALTHHVTPILVLAAAGALVGRLALVRGAPRRRRDATLH